jgi:hypothetical protein
MIEKQKIKTFSTFSNFQGQRKCLTYNVETGTWDQVRSFVTLFSLFYFCTKSNLFLHFLKFSDLLSIAYKASSVLVPNRGWHIFGGGSSRSGKTQKLSGLESEWEEGTDLYNGSDMYGFCSVQVPQKLRL